MGRAKQLMEDKGIVFNDECHVGTAKTVLLNNPNRYDLIYEASLSCIPTTKTYVSEGMVGIQLKLAS